MLPKLGTFVLILGMLTGCAGQTKRYEGIQVLAPIIYSEWVIGQELSSQFVGDKAFSVHPEQFKWQSMPGPFDCGGVKANGCYTHGPLRPGKIRWNAHTPQVIRHEAGHAILDKLGHPCGPKFQHNKKCGTR